MRKFNLSRVVIAGLLVVVLAVAIGVFRDVASSQAQPDGTISLQSPSFLSVAHAEENAIDSFTDDEAGIAAYFDAGMPINLNDVDQLYRTIEAQTSTYILGSVALTDYDENHDVHMYISTDGWVMAYYRDNEPTSKIYDWKHYDGGANLPTKLDLGLDIVAAEIGAIATPSYYHFNYPNATDMMLIAEWIDFWGTDSFEINIPSGFSYYERSWSLAKNSGRVIYYLDGAEISSTDNNNNWTFHQGTFSAAQLAPDTTHTVLIDKIVHGTNGFGGLALVYQVP